MTALEWMVVAAGVMSIAWVNWYFFGSRRGSVAAGAATAVPANGGVAEAVIVVDGGYSPSTVVAKAGVPVRLVFDRRDTASCSDEVVFPDFSIRRFLPTGERTVIEVTPPAPGRYEFMCGMSMLRGTLVVEA